MTSLHTFTPSVSRTVECPFFLRSGSLYVKFEGGCKNSSQTVWSSSLALEAMERLGSRSLARSHIYSLVQGVGYRQDIVQGADRQTTIRPYPSICFLEPGTPLSQLDKKETTITMSSSTALTFLNRMFNVTLPRLAEDRLLLLATIALLCWPILRVIMYLLTPKPYGFIPHLEDQRMIVGDAGRLAKFIKEKNCHTGQLARGSLRSPGGSPFLEIGFADECIVSVGS